MASDVHILLKIMDLLLLLQPQQSILNSGYYS